MSCSSPLPLKTPALAAAVASWGFSFYFGCRNSGAVQETMMANMDYLTLKEGNRSVDDLPKDATHKEVVAAFARGALLGARGNSGVIVSAYLNGFLNAVDGFREGGAVLNGASEVLYRIWGVRGQHARSAIGERACWPRTPQIR